MENKQTIESIKNWIRAEKTVSDRMKNMCICGSLLTSEHMADCRLFRKEVSKVFQEFELKTEVISR